MSNGRLERRQLVPRPLEELFPFFAEARNLQRITPDWLRFEVLTPDPIEMRVGALIDYRLRWRRLPIRWRTEIAAWEPPYRFVDRQIRGPYRLWHHEHRFEQCEDGTLVIDIVDYRAPFAFIAHPLMVDRDVARIFDYRQRALREIFG
jgi:hypothetical protein